MQLGESLLYATYLMFILNEGAVELCLGRQERWDLRGWQEEAGILGSGVEARMEGKTTRMKCIGKL